MQTGKVMLPDVQFSGVYRLVPKPLERKDKQELESFGKSDDEVWSLAYRILKAKGKLNNDKTLRLTYRGDTLIVQDDFYGKDRTKILKKPQDRYTTDQYFLQTDTKGQIYNIYAIYRIKKSETAALNYKLIGESNNRDYRLIIREFQSPDARNSGFNINFLC